MQRRLLLAGMRPISNVVDVSNYVMLEGGQPTHAFDANSVTNQHLIVRLAEEGERLLTLDKQERILSRDRLLIADQRGALSVAGVMGGYESEVSSTTTRVLLEAASWSPITIRRLRKPSGCLLKHRAASNAVSIPICPPRSTALLTAMQQVAGGVVAQGIVDVYPGPSQPPEIDPSASEVERLLGVELSPRRLRIAWSVWASPLVSRARLSCPCTELPAGRYKYQQISSKGWPASMATTTCRNASARRITSSVYRYPSRGGAGRQRCVGWQWII